MMVWTLGEVATFDFGASIDTANPLRVAAWAFFEAPATDSEPPLNSAAGEDTSCRLPDAPTMEFAPPAVPDAPCGRVAATLSEIPATGFVSLVLSITPLGYTVGP